MYLTKKLIGGVLDYLWRLYFALQLVCYLDFTYDVQFPPNGKLFMHRLASILELDLLNIEKWWQYYDPNFSIKNLAFEMKEESQIIHNQFWSMYNHLAFLVMVPVYLFALYFVLSKCFCRSQRA